MPLRALAILILTLSAALPAAGVPPLPEGIEPAPWKIEPQLKRLLDGVEEIRSASDRDAYLREIETVLEQHPDWIDLHRLYLILSSRSNRYPEIQETYRTRAAKDTTDADLQFLLGLAERGPASESYYRKALALDENHYFATCSLGLGLATGKPEDQDEGFGLLYKALKTRPDHPLAYQSLAIAFNRGVKDFESAIKVCRLWQDVVPWSAQPMRYEVGNLRQLGRVAEAKLLLEEFVKEHPENQAALRMLVDSHEREGRPTAAAETQVKLAELAKTSPDDAYKAATLLAGVQETEEALRWLMEAARRGLDDRSQPEGDPKLVALRGEAAFAEALEEMDRAHERKIPERKAEVLAGLIDRPAPSFAVETLEGKSLSLDGLNGRLIVLDFWATWCGPCRKTLPLLQKLQTAMADRPVEIIAMNVWERDAARVKVAPYWKQNRYTMQVGLASNADAKSYGVTGIPTLFVIDQKGRIRYTHRGYAPFMNEEVAWVIDSLLSVAD